MKGQKHRIRGKCHICGWINKRGMIKCKHYEERGLTGWIEGVKVL